MPAHKNTSCDSANNDSHGPEKTSFSYLTKIRYFLQISASTQVLNLCTQTNRQSAPVAYMLLTDQSECSLLHTCYWPTHQSAPCRIHPMDQPIRVYLVVYMLLTNQSEFSLSHTCYWAHSQASKWQCQCQVRTNGEKWPVNWRKCRTSARFHKLSIQHHYWALNAWLHVATSNISSK